MKITSVTGLAHAYRYCEKITQNSAKNFIYSFFFLPHKVKMMINALYAFCRRCDDISDEAYDRAEKLRLIRQISNKLASCYEDSIPDDPVFVALKDTINKAKIPRQLLQQIINGVEQDIFKDRYETFDELYNYCFKVASCVGLVCLKIIGCAFERTKKYAVDLGIAMQLTNILRDVMEDHQRSRIYIPQEDLRLFNYSEQDLALGKVNENFIRLMKFQISRAHSYFERSRPIFKYLRKFSKSFPAILSSIYIGILRKIEQRGFNIFLNKIRLTSLEKVFNSLIGIARAYY